MLANSKAKSDDVVKNFLENYDCDIIVWLNPICPLQSSIEIKQNFKKINKNIANQRFSNVIKNHFKIHKDRSEPNPCK